MEPWIHSVFISPGLEGIIEIDVFDSWSNSHIWILVYRLSVIMVWKAKLKPLKLSFYFGQHSKSKVMCFKERCQTLVILLKT